MDTHESNERKIEVIIRLQDDGIDRPGTVKVLLHDSYGGDGIPGWLRDEYLKRTRPDLPDKCSCIQKYHSPFCPLCEARHEIDDKQLRYDPLCLQIMRDAFEGRVKIFIPSFFRDDASTREDSWIMRRIPEGCKDYIQIREYDGKESLHIDDARLLVHLLEKRNDESSRAILAEYRSIKGK